MRNRTPRTRSGRSVLAALAMLATVAAGCTLPERPAEVGRRAPAYQAPDLAGAPVALGDFRGDVVAITLWATWCQACRRTLPGLQEMERQLAREGFRVLAVNIDPAGSERAIREFLDELGLEFTVLQDPKQEAARLFGARGVPETFLIGRDGTLLHHWIGRVDARSPAVREPVYAALGPPPGVRAGR
jgi:cytochrome c biogenesis protein CcmG, thiol:disulfide interchange protein DsbE